jgi:hypothetical protein
MDDVFSAQKLKPPVPLVIDVNDHCREAGEISVTILKLNPRIRPRAFAGTKHHPPIVARILFEQQELKRPARLAVAAPESGRYDSGIVQDEDVSRSDVFDKVGKRLVSECS